MQPEVNGGDGGVARTQHLRRGRGVALKRKAGIVHPEGSGDGPESNHQGTAASKAVMPLTVTPSASRW